VQKVGIGCENRITDLREKSDNLKPKYKRWI
jgi:hypothetical protein